MGSREKLNRLRTILRDCSPCVIAFSGGVDSTFLAGVAVRELGKDALAVTLSSPFVPAAEKREAVRLAREIGMRHRILPVDLPAALHDNPSDRCYHCKKRMYGSLIRFARRSGMACVLDGSNADDLRDFRPGRKAMRELGVRSPLQEAGFTKTEIRRSSRAMGLETWDKPALACLATRFPTGERLTARALSMVEEAEEFLRGLGARQLRVRYHGGVARIEAEPAQMRMFLARRREISLKMRSLGFARAALDLDGYAMGTMNRIEVWKRGR